MKDNLEELLEDSEKTYYHFKDGKIEVADTYKVQRASICLFASQVGYAYDIFSEVDGGSFYNAIGKELSHMETVSFETMQKWHNKCFLDNSCWHGLESELPSMADKLNIPLEFMRNAIDSKLVKRTYFQVTKGKRLKVQKAIVSFA